MNTNPALGGRYARHFALPDFGPQEQNKLREGSVLVVGAGGLGSPLLLYLAAAGLGKIGIIDHDEVDVSNLQRQILYTGADEGQSKAEVAARRLRRLNPEVDIEVFPFRLSANNALELIARYDCVADGSDNFPTRYLVNDACVLLGKPNVYASVFRYEGQVSVFNMLREDGSRGPHYRDLYPEPPPPQSIPNCAEAGVLGTLTGIVGSIQANEVLKLITGLGEPLDARLFLLDSRNMRTQILQLPPVSRFPVKQLAEDYENAACELPVPEIGFRQMLEWREEGRSFELLDVRSPHERLAGHLGGLHIPLEQLLAQCEQLDATKTWIVYCHSGIRSATATRRLLERGFREVYNLKGGMVQAMRHKQANP